MAKYVEDEILIKALIKYKLLNREDLPHLEAMFKKFRAAKGLTSLLVNTLKINELKVAQVIAKEFNVPFLPSIEGQTGVNAPGVSDDELAKLRVIPVILEKKELTVALIDPPYKNMIDTLARSTNRKIIPVIVTASAFKTLWQTKNSKTTPTEKPQNFALESIDISRRGKEWGETADKNTALPSAPNVITKFLESAMDFEASDIHLEMTREGYLDIRVRLDGVLHRMARLPRAYSKTIPSILKSGSVDPFKKKITQEGQATFSIRGQKIQTKIHVVPTVNGDRIKMRLLNKKLQAKNISELGLANNDFDRLQALVRHPEGIILFASPASSGKTSTMYSVINELKDTKINIAIVEKPIECQIDGINQISLDEKSENEIADVIRAILSHDIDILGVGEIRTKQEADTIVEAGLTGIKVLTTIQAPDAIQTLFRLQNLGMERNQIALVVRGIVAQRFVRKLCTKCKEKHRPEPALLESIGLVNLPPDEYFYRGQGCKACQGTGYQSRIPLYEIFTLNEEVTHVFQRGGMHGEILRVAQATGFTDFRYDGLRKALAGITSLEEVLRVS